MPYRDGTGPMGRGPLTGRGLGPCGGGQAFGRGIGRGFGWRRMPYAEPVILTKDEQKKVLEASLTELEAEIKQIKGKIEELN